MGFCSDKAAARRFGARINLEVNEDGVCRCGEEDKGDFCLILGDGENKRMLKLGQWILLMGLNFNFVLQQLTPNLSFKILARR